MPARIRPYRAVTDESWATSFLEEHLGGRRQARRRELTALGARPSGRGTGTALLAALVSAARGLGVRRIWVVTTNDNIDAIAFYQRRGFRLSELRVGAVDEARRTLKPALPVIGQHRIEMRDELKLTLLVSPR
ncbi:MAG: putative acetyltransferase [Chloroflexota bacterium]|nr:putative acetyltransferase [Chloroflexota bacterium]